VTILLVVAFSAALQLSAHESAAQRHAMATNHLKRVAMERSAR
jgi:hypothetical protein